jgi:hypothetical protein
MMLGGSYVLIIYCFDVKDGFEPSYRVLPTHTSPLGHLTLYIKYKHSD